MQNRHFFAIPLIFVVSYLLLSTTITIYQFSSRMINNDLDMSFFIYYMASMFSYRIFDFFFLMVVTSILAYRYRLLALNQQNILLILLAMVLFFGFQWGLYVYINPLLSKYIFDGFYSTTLVMFFIKSLIINQCLSILIIWFIFFIFSQLIPHNKLFEFTPDNYRSICAHFHGLLIMAIFSYFSSLQMGSTIRSIYYGSTAYFSIVLIIGSPIVNGLTYWIIYAITKSQFQINYHRLPIGRIIYCALWTLLKFALFAIVLGVLLGMVIFLLMDSFYYGDYYLRPFLFFILLSIVFISSTVVIVWMCRRSVRRFFSQNSTGIAFNNNQSNGSLD